MLPMMRASDPRSHALDASYIKRAVELADKSAGFTSPHPNFGCVIVAGKVVGEGYLYAQGTTPAEVQAVEAAGACCRDATTYLNMEPGDCHGEHTAVSALVKVCNLILIINNVLNAFVIVNYCYNLGLCEGLFAII